MINSANAEHLRVVFASTTIHTYTRTTVTEGSTNAHHEVTETAGTVTNDIPCLYGNARTVRQSDVGRVTVLEPVLYTRHDDPIKTNDLISNVKDRNGAVLLAGPVEVVDLIPHADGGELLYKQCILAGGETK